MAVYDPNDKREIKVETIGDKITKGLAVIPDVGHNISYGVAKGIEGIADFFATASGFFGNDEYREKVKQFVEQDNADAILNVMESANPVDKYLYPYLADQAEAAGKQNIANLLRANTFSQSSDISYLNDNQAGEFVRGLAQSAGGMALDALVGAGVGHVAGAAGALPSVVQKVQRGASLATLGVRAAGTGTEEAYQDGATFYRGAAYGAAQGATEVATEMLFDSPVNRVYGKGLLSPVKQSMTKTGVRLARDLTGEAIEEVASELVNPLERSIYKGASALREYGTGDYWKQVGLAGASGAAMAGIMGAGQGAYTTRGSADYYAREALADMTKRENLDARGKLTDKQAADFQKSITANVNNASAYLSRMSDEARAKYLAENKGLAKIFDEKGKVRAEFADRMTGNGATPKYASVNARYGVERINRDLEKASAKTGEKLTVYDGTLNEAEENRWGRAKRLVNKLNTETGGAIGLVLTSESNTVNAFQKDGNIYLAKNHLSDENMAKTIVEEAVHTLQTTDENGKYDNDYYKLLHALALTDNKAAAIEKSIRARYPNLAKVDFDEIEKKYASGEKLSSDEQEMVDEIGAQVTAEILGGNEEFVKRFAENPKFAERFLNAFEHVKNALSRMTDKEAKAAHRKMLDTERLLLKALAENGYAYVDGRVVKKEKKEPEDVENEDGVRYNLATWRDRVIVDEDGTMTSGREKLIRSMREIGWKESEIKKVVSDVDQVADFIDDLRKDYPSLDEVSDLTPHYRPDGTIILSCVVSNGEYELNIDFTTICKKRENLSRFLTEYVESGKNFGKNGFDKKAQAYLENLFKKYDLDTACTFCFVESRRRNVDTWSKKFAKLWSDTLRGVGVTNAPKISSVKELGKIDPINGITDAIAFDVASAIESDALATTETADEFYRVLYDERRADGKKHAPDTKERMAEYVRNHAKDGKLLAIDANDLLSVRVITYIKATMPDLYSILLTSYGAAAPKQTLPAAPYSSEAFLNSTFGNVENLEQRTLEIGGMRLNSFSDIQITRILDYVQMIADATAMKAAVQTYTKELVQVRILGKSGLKQNMSLIPEVDIAVDKEHAGLDANGNYILSSDSVNAQEAFDLQEREGMKGDVGTVLVGISKYQIIKALNDDRIKMIIPYHKSGMPRQLSIFFNLDLYTDYTQYQNTRSADGKQIHDPFLKVFYDSYIRNKGDYLKATQDYLAYCKANNLIPRFALEWDANKSFEENLRSEGNYITSNPNYYKVLIDFTSDGGIDENGNRIFKQQKAVKLDLDGIDVKEIIKDELDKYEAGRKKYEANKYAMFDEFQAAMNGTIDLKEMKATRDARIAEENKQNIVEDDRVRLSRVTPAQDRAYNSLAEKYKSGTATKEETAELDRMVREAAKKAGYSVKGYHGTPNGTFTKFRDWSYFTDNKEYADRYQNQGASSNGYKNTADNPMTYSVYLDPSNIFDTRKSKDRKIFEDEFYGQWGNGTPLSDKGLPDWTDGDDLIEFFEDKGYDYDAFYLDEGATGGYGNDVQDRGVSIIVKKSSQVKSADPVTYDNNGNIIPLSERFNSEKDDIRFSRGQNAKFAANQTGKRVHSRKETQAAVEKMVADIVLGDEYQQFTGGLHGKGKRLAVDYLWEKLNRTPKEHQRAVAEKAAQQIIDSTVMTETWADPAVFPEKDQEIVDRAKSIVSVMTDYMHRIDFDSIRGDVKFAKDDRFKDYARMWAAKGEKAVSPDLLADAFAEIGINLDATNEADIFLAAVDQYEKAKETVKNAVEKVALSEYGSKEELAAVKQKLVDEILDVFETGGQESKFSKLVSQYRNSIQFMKDMRSITDKVKEIRLQGKRFASDNRPENLKKALDSLSGIVRGNMLSPKVARQACRDLYEWYSKDNPMFEGIPMYVEQVREMMGLIADGTGPLTAEEMTDLEHVVDFMANLEKNFKRVYRSGEWKDAEKDAERFVETARQAGKKQPNNPVIRGVVAAGRTYMLSVFDPATVARMADRYRGGFFTQLYEELREGAFMQEKIRIELNEGRDAFYKEHKGYNPEKRTVNVRGTEMTAAHAISLYMTTKRKQAWRGLVKSGYLLFMNGEEKAAPALGDAKINYTDEQIEQMVAEFRRDVEKQLSDTDKEYVGVMEKILKRAGKLKTERDIQRYGFTNATEDYYYPILRSHVARNLDANLASGKNGYYDVVSSLSMNKDTMQNAEGELGIQTVDAVMSRHINQTAMYYGLSNVIDNFNTISNLNLSDNAGKPLTVRGAVDESAFGKSALSYFQELIKDLEGVRGNSDLAENAVNRLIGKVRSNVAVASISLNPKVIFTQFSSIFAGTAILSPRDLFSGIRLMRLGKSSKLDQYSEVARLRNAEYGAARGETLTDKVGKVGEIGMKFVSATDRLVVQIEFAACQAHVARTQHLAVGSEENLKAAGKLMDKVIYETQQSSVLTERSAFARSENEILKGLAMFRMDAMKQIGRVIDAFGELSAIKEDLKATKDEAAVQELKGRQKTVGRKAAKAVGALVGTALYQALIGLLFAAFLNRLKDKEPDEIVRDTVVDGFAGLITGLPVISQAVEFFADGYEVENFTISAFNDLLKSTKSLANLASGKATASDVKNALRTSLYAGGNLLGIPVRNTYNYFYGTVNTIDDYAGYKVHSLLYSDNYKTELYRAIEEGDTERVQMLSKLLADTSLGGYGKNTKEAIIPLVEAGYTVLPKEIGDSVTYDGRTYEMTARQRARFKKIYGQSEAAVQKVVSLQSYKKLDPAVKAKTIKSIYDMYYGLAVDDMLGTDTENKNVLFSYAIDPDKLALIVAQAKSIEADRDKNGKAIAGSKKQKVVAYINGLNLTAAQKYMIMGYLGYQNTKGEEQVNAYIGRLKLSKKEKEALLAYSGYGEADDVA